MLVHWCKSVRRGRGRILSRACYQGVLVGGHWVGRGRGGDHHRRRVGRGIDTQKSLKNIRKNKIVVEKTGGQVILSHNSDNPPIVWQKALPPPSPRPLRPCPPPSSAAAAIPPAFGRRRGGRRRRGGERKEKFKGKEEEGGGGRL